MDKPGEQSTNYVVGFRRVTLRGDTFYLPRYALHRPACQAFLAGAHYEPETHALVVGLLASRGGDMIHAGAFFGDMLPSFSRACVGTVYAFEPVLENYVLAKLCVEKNRLSNVVMFNAGVGHSLDVGCVNTGFHLHRGGGSEISDSGQATTLMRIDGLALRALALLHLDVEGYELNALNGAQETINRCRPVILIEDNRRNCGKFLISLGYEHCGDVPGLEIWQHAVSRA